MMGRTLDIRSLTNIRNCYQQAQNRLILFDFDGTLVPLAATPEIAILNEEAETLIRKLTCEGKNKVVIVSGRESDFLENQFRNFSVMLIAEHGYLIRNPGKSWIISKKVDHGWQDRILPLFDKYLRLCPGSFIERKQASLAFHYRNVNKKICFNRIPELKNDLTGLIDSSSKLKILEGDKVLEIKSILYDKGTAVSEIVSKEKFDFILSVGDDVTDEDMFRAIPEYGYTFKIGFSPTGARYSIKSQSEIYRILNYISSD
jgi:trehalose 6-phosphate synthase/phosphatase